MEVTLPIISLEECQNKSAYIIQDTVVCTLAEGGGKDACKVTFFSFTPHIW